MHPTTQKYLNEQHLPASAESSTGGVISAEEFGHVLMYLLGALLIKHISVALSPDRKTISSTETQ